jgi:outer membrane protein assembly factor BamB
MAGANLQRTSVSLADVSVVTSVAWYRPIEAFISGATQLVTAGGRVYVATAKGLVVLNAEDGSLACRFDTELPVATPTVDGGAVYVPGFDRTLYSLNAATCGINWAFTGAGAGFSANPLVVGGRVYLGNRDGRFYAINSSNGTLAWSYPTAGPIMQSAAYDAGVAYFASMDMYGYALNTSTGALVWRTPQKLPGEQYTSWWPVVHGNYLVWAASTAYKFNGSPGSIDAGADGVDFDAFFGATTTTLNAGTVISSSDGSHGWPAGSAVISTTAGSGPHTLQGWANAFPARRVYAITNKSNGAEPFYLPMLESGQNEQGQMHPPLSDGTALYFNGPYQRSGGNIPRSRAMAWREGSAWLRMVGSSTFAADEPLILSMSAGRMFANLCCDREARVLQPSGATFWHYSSMLHNVLPSQTAANPYDPMWAFYDGAGFLERLGGYYKGNINSRNGVYNSHGHQNPLVPHAFTNASSQRVARMFTHRSNAIIGLGPTASKTPLPLVTINTNPANTGRTLTAAQLQSRLETEVAKMVDLFLANGTNGFLRPAYISDGGGVSNTTVMPESDVYFRVPADTVYTLASAYPHLSTTLKANVLAYLAAYWQRYFVGSQVRLIGWNSGAPREAMVYPPEVSTRMSQIGDSSGGAPPRVFLAAAKYAQLVPSQAATIYSRVRPLLVYPPPLLDIVRGPGVFNDYIVGYQGFLNLHDLAGNPDPVLRAGVAAQLAILLNTRLISFAKDHPWEGSVDNPGGVGINNYVRKFNCARNFLYMAPDLGQAMRSSAQFGLITSAINEYSYVCPHWFITRDHNAFQEASASHIFDSHALFLAKAYVARDSQANLSKWIDVPWMLGDLYHMQNLTAALQAQ